MLGKSGRAILDALVAGKIRSGLRPWRIATSSPQKPSWRGPARARDASSSLPAEAPPAGAGRAPCFPRHARRRNRGRPFCAAVDIVSSHPGINKLSAEAIVSEIGADMSRFATAGHLVSWAHLCPRNDESAGKRRSNRLRQGARWLKTTLVQCAHAAKNKRGSYYQAQYLRLCSRRGPQKAICAVAASMLTAIYHMLTNGTLYQDLGADHFGGAPSRPHTPPGQTPRAHGLCRTNYPARRLIAGDRLPPEREVSCKRRQGGVGWFGRGSYLWVPPIVKRSGAGAVFDADSWRRLPT